MALDSYSGLKTEIANHLDRDDLTDQIDNFIDLAEARHKRDIRIREMVVRAQSSVNDRYAALPSDFLEMKTFRLLTSPVTVLTEVSLHEINRLRAESNGTPAYFTVHEEIEFDRNPDSSITSEMVYFASLTPLSDSGTTNSLLQRAPDAYLYASLLAAEPYLMNDERLKTWANLYSTAVDSVNGMDRKRAGPLVSRVVGATP